MHHLLRPRLCRPFQAFALLLPLLLCLVTSHDTCRGSASTSASASASATTSTSPHASSPSTSASAYLTGCSMDEVWASSLSLAEFRRAYAGKRPVVIHGVDDNDRFRRMTARLELLSRFGAMEVVLASSNTFSKKKRRTTLHDYLSTLDTAIDGAINGTETFYLFGDNFSDEWQQFYAHYDFPAYAGTRNTPAFGAGGPSSGVPFHVHGPAFGETLHGRKRWFLAPPYQEPRFDPAQSQLQWVNLVYPGLPKEQRPLVCTVSPGSLIYIPHHWWHATLNLDNYTVFMSTW